MRILQQLLLESLILSLGGAAAGLTAASWGLSGLLALVPHNAPLPRMESVHLDGRVFAFAIGLSAVAAIVSGLAPAIHLARLEPGGSLKPGLVRAGVAGSRMLRRFFVTAQVALSLLLLTGAGLMARSFVKLTSVDPGFQPEQVLTAQMFCLPARYGDRRKRSEYLENVLSQLRTSPGVQAAGCINFLPLEENASGSCFAPVGEPPPDTHSPSSHILVVSTGYFQAMRTPLLDGRDFSDRDGFGSPSVALINHAFAERYFDGQDPIGKRLNLCWSVPNPVEIVGVVADARQTELRTSPAPAIFLTNAQTPAYFVALVVRARGDLSQMQRSMEAAVHRVDPEQPVYDVRTMEEVRFESVARPRLQLALLSIFGGIALVLATIGVYGVLSYSIDQRTQELGIRFALGARGSDVVWLVMREGLALTALGIALGLGGALALTSTLRSLLFEITPTDPVTMASASCLLLVIAALATTIPSRRASRVDPMAALREE
jgi:putative ABC transport system permease protein